MAGDDACETLLTTLAECEQLHHTGNDVGLALGLAIRHGDIESARALKDEHNRLRSAAELHIASIRSLLISHIKASDMNGSVSDHDSKYYSIIAQLNEIERPRILISPLKPESDSGFINNSLTGTGHRENY